MRFNFLFLLVVAFCLIACGGGEREVAVPEVSVPEQPTSQFKIELSSVFESGEQLSLTANLVDAVGDIASYAFKWKQKTDAQIELTGLQASVLHVDYSQLEASQAVTFEVEVIDSQANSVTAAITVVLQKETIEPLEIEINTAFESDTQLSLTANLLNAVGDTKSYAFKWQQVTSSDLELTGIQEQVLQINYRQLKTDQSVVFEVEVTDVNSNTVTEAIAVNIKVPKSIFIVVDRELRASIESELVEFKSAISADTASDVTIVDSPDNASELRAMLKKEVSDKNLRGAIFVGNVPVVYDLRINASKRFVNLSDHYFRALECPYQETANPEEKLEPQYSSLMQTCMPTIWVSRILTYSNNVERIKAYIAKNVALRNAPDVYQAKVEINNSMGWDNHKINEDKLLELYQSYRDNFSVDLNYVLDLSSVEQKQSFTDAMSSNIEILTLNVHGASKSVLFNGINRGDNALLTVSDLADYGTSPKVVSLLSCSVGDYKTPGYLAGEILFNSQTLLVEAMPTVVSVSNTFEFQRRFMYSSLYLGSSYADVYKYHYMGTPGHFYGDPTIRIREKLPLDVAPNIVVDNIDYNEPFTHQVVFDDVLQGERDVKEFEIKNTGNSVLQLTIGSAKWFTINNNTVPLEGMSGGFVFDIDDNDPAINYVVTGFWDGTMDFSVQPNQTVKVKLVFDPTVDNAQPESAVYSASITVRTNDPNAPIFDLKLKGAKVTN